MTRTARTGWLLVAALTLAAQAPAAAKPRARPDKRSAKRSDACEGDPARPGPGLLEPFRPPATKAAELNAAAKIPYRQGKWDEARAQYGAALAADPDFLAPKLNIACSFVRQERFAEATTEVKGLLERAYVPWAREILDAADLGALKARPEMIQIKSAMAASAARWGEGLDEAFLYVARQRPPLRMPDGPGVFLLNPSQEVWAYLPRTQRYRQITAEDGHVVALARSVDGQRIAYVTAEKLVRGAREDDVSLRGVAVHVLALSTMTSEHDERIEGDIVRVEIGRQGPSFWIRTGDTKNHWRLSPLGPAGTVPTRAHEVLRPSVVLTGKGTDPIREQRLGRTCVLTARYEIETSGLVVLRLYEGKGRVALTNVATGSGAGLGGLSLP